MAAMESHDPYLNHWADQAAAKTLAAHPEEVDWSHVVHAAQDFPTRWQDWGTDGAAERAAEVVLRVGRG